MLKNKKILHITNSDKGGAGIAAQRINQTLVNEGVNSKMLVLSDSNYPNTKEFVPSIFKKIVNKFSNKIPKVLGRIAEKNLVGKLEGEYEIITTPKTIYKVEDSAEFQNADIIHLHWISNFINYESFFKKIGNKKLVWTFHDMNPFMGGFHYEGDKKNNPNLKTYEDKFLDLKKKAYKDLSEKNFSIVFLNEWMQEKCKTSNAFPSYKEFIIPNCIDFSQFGYRDSEAVKKEFGINTDKKIIAFASQSLDNKRKGFDILLDSLNDIDTKDIVILTFGSKTSIPSRDFEIIQLGEISSIELMSKVYSVADLFILPTREDNLPNVMLESWACGTPVVSFANGGMREYIKNGFNGELIEQIDAKELAKTINSALGKDYNREEIIDFAKKNFSPDIVIDKLVSQVYM